MLERLAVFASLVLADVAQDMGVTLAVKFGGDHLDDVVEFVSGLSAIRRIRSGLYAPFQSCCVHRTYVAI